MGFGQPRSVVAALDKHLVSDKKFWVEQASEPTEKKSGLGGFIGSFNKSDSKEYLYDMGIYYSRGEEMMIAVQRMFMNELRKVRN
jgi:hypothetical protein